MGADADGWGRESMDAVALFRANQTGYLPGHLGLDWVEIKRGFVRGRFDVGKHHLAPNGYRHAAAVVAMADTACGYGCIVSLPDGATGFTTAELKTNFIGTALKGGISCEARLVHGGRTTQVWDAEVKSEASEKTSPCFAAPRLFYPSPAVLNRAKQIVDLGVS
jgi:1,4-dihydroxy-2-naphthoyl-CoA hydrolase